MNDLFVPYNIALQLKEIGFDEECFGYYRSLYPNYFVFFSDWKSGLRSITNSSGYEHESYFGPTSPFYDQVVNWFIEKHNIFIIPHPVFGEEGKCGYDSFRHSGYDYQIIQPLNKFDKKCFYIGGLNDDVFLPNKYFRKEDLTIGEEERIIYRDRKESIIAGIEEGISLIKKWKSRNE